MSVSDLKQNRRGRRSGVKQDTGDEHALRARDRHRRIAVGGHQGRKSEPEHYRVRPRHLDGLVELIDARREDQVLAAVNRSVDRGGGVSRPGDEELVDGKRRGGSRSAGPRRA